MKINNVWNNILMCIPIIGLLYTAYIGITKGMKYEITNSWLIFWASVLINSGSICYFIWIMVK